MPKPLTAVVKVTSGETTHGHPVGKELKLDVKTAEKWIENGWVEPCDYSPRPAKEEVEKAVAEATESIKKDYESTLADRVKEKTEEEVEKRIKEMRKTPADSEDKRHVRIGRIHERLEDDPNGGFSSIGEFGKAVYECDPFVNRRPMDDRLKLAKNKSGEAFKEIQKAVGSDELTISSDPYGGYLIPTAFSDRILEVIHSDASILSQLQTVPMTTDAIEIPGIDETSQAQGSLFGGITCAFRSETEQMTGSRPKFRVIHLSLNELYALVFVSERLLAKSPTSLELFLNRALPETIRWKLEGMVLNGTGAGQPLGVLNSPALVTSSAVGGQGANTLVYDNIIQMWSQLYGPYRNNAVWLYNQDVEPQLFAMSLTVGTGGSAVFVTNATEGPPMRIFGRPAMAFPHCQSLGTAGDIVLMDPSQYLIGRETAEEFKSATSMHLRFDYAQMAFRVQHFTDGQPWWRTTMTPAISTTAQSPFVVLSSTRT